MRYQKTIQLWGIEDKLRSGEIKLQTGQWVQCGQGPKSRFVSADEFSINVAHGNTTKEATKKFIERVAYRKGFVSIGCSKYFK